MLPTRYAPFFKRLVAHVVDEFLAALIVLCLLTPLILFSLPSIFPHPLFSHWKFWSPIFHREDLEDLFRSWIPFGLPVIVFWILALISVNWFYYAIFESSPRQATPGKMMMGIFVTDLYGNRITFPRALGRVVSKMLSKACCYLGYLLALFTDRSQALHDFIAGTLVLEPDYSRMQAFSAPGPVTQETPQSPGGTVPE
jgi:uncharacterized RDD family membrane protein YckC